MTTNTVLEPTAAALFRATVAVVRRVPCAPSSSLAVVAQMGLVRSQNFSLFPSRFVYPLLHKVNYFQSEK